MSCQIKTNVDRLGGTNMRLYLSKIRMEKGYSQRRVAREAGISFQHYSKIENGDRGSKVSFLIIGRIAKALDISLEKFLDMETAYQNSLDLAKEKDNYDD